MSGVLERLPCRPAAEIPRFRRCRDLGVSYVGICRGAGPHHVRAMAEALGRTVPASKYSPSMDLHPILGAAASSQDPLCLTPGT